MNLVRIAVAKLSLPTFLQHMARIRLHHQPHPRTRLQVKRLASTGGEVHFEFGAAIYLRDHGNVALPQRRDNSCQHIASTQSLRRSGGYKDIAGADSDAYWLRGVDAR